MATERYACPMCGWWRTAKWGTDQKTGQPRELRFDKVEVEVAPMWRLEQLHGAGRGSPNASIELLGIKKLKELPQEYKDQIITQCKRILKELEL